MNTKIEESINQINNNFFSDVTIIEEVFRIVKFIFSSSSINIYIFNNETKKIDFTLSNNDLWPIPNNLIRWLTNTSNKYHQSHIFIPNRKEFILTDFNQLKTDQESYDYSCNDGLLVNIINEEKTIYGTIFIHNWTSKQTLANYYPNLNSKINSISSYIKQIINSIENYHIHKKIASLLDDKNKLTQKIHEDKQSLNRRLTELTTLYETSNELSQSLNHIEIIESISRSINKVLSYDACSIYLKKIFNKNELFVTVGSNFNSATIKDLTNRSLSCIYDNFSSESDPNNIDIKIKKLNKSFKPSETIIQSQATVPLIFQNEAIGLITLLSYKKNAFQNYEKQFINTISINIASTLGKIKIIRELEKSKIYSVIESITEPIIIIDEKNTINIINPQAAALLNINSNQTIMYDKLINLLDELRLVKLYQKVKKTKIPVINELASYNQKNFMVNISPVINKEYGYVGIIFLFRDITHIQQMDRIKSQRLEAISEVNKMINSIENLDNLLEEIMEFLLKTTNCNMGSIQLKQKDRFITASHINFPEKIRRSYRYNNRETISDKVEKSKQLIFIDNYFSSPNLDPNVKILIDLYLCIPIMINNELIGIINLAKKYGTSSTNFTKEDIDTLQTITTLVATTIHNSMLHKDKLEKENIDQELKLASEIHNNLLPINLPKEPKLLIGTLNIPAQRIGGDFYDFIELDKNRTGIIIADIVGKGIPAGLYMAVLKSIINRTINAKQTPKETIQELNKVIYADPVINKFVPLFYGILDSQKNLFTYSNAGHEPGYILRENKFIKLDTKGFPLAGFKNQTFVEKKIEIKDSDLFVFFTDGILEIKIANNTSIGLNGFKSFIQKNQKFPPQIILDKIKNYISGTENSPVKKDDITVIACKFNQKLNYKNQLLLTKSIATLSSISEIKKMRIEVDTICKATNLEGSLKLDLQLAVNEAQANIIEHAYLGDPNKPIYFHFSVYEDKIEIMIKDNGIPLKSSSIEKKISNNLEKLEGSGLGLFLIYTLMDEIEFTSKNKENNLKLVKYILQ
jgi:sigma-B regulation protein RsbU (phosphoserine phosphatase)